MAIGGAGSGRIEIGFAVCGARDAGRGIVQPLGICVGDQGDADEDDGCALHFRN